MANTSQQSRPNRTGAATRARIITAAITVLAEKGFSGFTLQAVANNAEVFYGNLTHHYPTRDALIAAMLEAILERYRARFDELVASLSAEETPIRSLVVWLIEDAISPETAPVMLELWAMATHNPDVAKGVSELYDGAVEACISSLGVDPASPQSSRLRDALYVLGTVLEGSSSIFYNRQVSDTRHAGFRREAVEMLVPYLEQCFAEAKKAR